MIDHFGLKHSDLESPFHSLLETAHNGSYVKYDVMTPLHQQRKYFSQLRFPVYSQTEAWKEKASLFLLKLFFSHYCFHHSGAFDLFGMRDV